MRFEIYSKDLKALVDRVSAVVPKKPALNYLTYVKVEVIGKNLKIHATDVDNYIIARTDVNSYEDGVVWVRYDDLKRVTGMAGDVTVSSTENTMRFANGNKAYEISCTDFNDVFPEIPLIGLNPKHAMTITDKAIVEALKKISCCISSNDANKIMQSYDFNLDENEIATIDGFRIGIAKIRPSASDGGRFLIDRKILPILTAAVGKNKTVENIDVKVDTKIACWKTADFSLFTRLVDGTGYNYRQMTETPQDWRVKACTRSLERIAKEYVKVGKIDSTKPMMFYKNSSKNVFATSMEFADFRTSDVFDVDGYTEEIKFGMNPQFIADACSSLDDDAVITGVYKSNAPIIIKDNNYKFLLLPVNVNEASFGFVTKQFEEA